MKLHNLFEIWIEDIFWDRYLCLQPTKKHDYINETLASSHFQFNIFEHVLRTHK